MATLSSGSRSVFGITQRGGLRLLAGAMLLATLVSSARFALAAAPAPATAPAQSSIAGATILNRDQTSEILPPSVFFRGQSATVQGRNSAGVRLANGQLVLTAVVDTSGYSSALQQSYQAYLITEVPLIFGGQHLPPGAYGFGFLAGNRLVLMDIGGNEILHTLTARDEFLQRPNPLQILQSGNDFRLYLGRSYVTFTPAAK